MSIADKITTLTEKIPEVYDAGIERMWEDITIGGTRTNYYHAFRNGGMSMEGIKPTHDIKVVGDGTEMFRNVKNTGTEPIDLKAVEERQGIKFDFSECTNPYQMFYLSEIDTLNILDLSNANANANCLYFLFADCKIRWIEKLIISENTSKFNTSFYKATDLTHCIFEGVINKTGLIINSYTLLDKESIISIVNCLSDETEGLGVTIHKTSVAKAFETAEGKNDGLNSEEWLSLVATKPNWTIAT